MLFYKVEGILTDIATENNDSRKAHRENIRKLSIKSNDFNQRNDKDSFYFIADSSDGVLSLGIITERSDNICKC